MVIRNPVTGMSVTSNSAPINRDFGTLTRYAGTDHPQSCTIVQFLLPMCSLCCRRSLDDGSLPSGGAPSIRPDLRDQDGPPPAVALLRSECERYFAPTIEKGLQLRQGL